MNIKPAIAMLTLFMVTNINAGWFDDLISGNDKTKETIENVKQVVTNKDVTQNVTSALSNQDIVTGLKQALNKGADYAVDSLGTTDGFMNNSSVKIAMPEKLAKVESLLRKAGKDKYADEFVTTMNRAAESAVPLTLNIIKQSVAEMSIDDAQRILDGSDDAATQYLKKTGSNKINAQVYPIVQQATAQANVTSLYKTMYGKLGFAGKYLNLGDYDVDSYVTQKTTEGLFTLIAQEEKKIRENPAERTSAILKSVFESN